MTLASVIIPTFNEDERLVSAVRSVLGQTHRDLELIVVDDASCMPAEDVLRDVDDSRLRFIRHDRNKGAAAARNTGVAAARGPVLAFLDADDLWRADKLACQISVLSDEDAVTAGNCCSYFLIRNSRDWSVRILRPVTDWPNHLAWGCDLSPGSTLVIRREAFERVGPFDDTLQRFEDWDWLIRFSDFYRLGVVEAPLVYIHVDAPPSEEATRHAVGRMWDKHHTTGRRHPAFDRRFRSALMLERAAIVYRTQRRGAAIALTLKALAIAPLRNARFYWRMGQNLFSSGRRWKWRGTNSTVAAGIGRQITDRILHVITSLDVGGAEGALVSLISALPSERRPLGVVCLGPRGPLADRIEALGVSVTALNMRPGRPSLGALMRLVLLIRRTRPAIVQSWMYHADLVALVAVTLSGRRRKTALVWGIRCSDMNFSNYSRGLRSIVRLNARLSRLPDAVVANSRIGRDVHVLRGYRPRALHVVYNGVDTVRYAPDPAARFAVRAELEVAPDSVVLALVARVDPMKDHAGFFAAMDRITGATALLVGLGTTNLPHRDNVCALGLRDDVPRLLAAADIVVSSSAYGEGFSNAVAEGMSTGLAPVATAVGDASHMVGDVGIVVPPCDPEALAAALQALIDDPTRRTELGRRARRRIEENFSLQAFSGHFAAVYEQVLTGCRIAG